MEIRGRYMGDFERRSCLFTSGYLMVLFARKYCMAGIWWKWSDSEVFEHQA